jgi:hypothetical protein
MMAGATLPRVVSPELLKARREFLTTAEVCRVLGVRWRTVKEELIETGRLKMLVDKEHALWPVPYDSLVACVKGLVPAREDAEMWIEDCLKSGERLLQGGRAARYIGDITKTLTALADDGEVRFIFSPNRAERYYLPSSLLKYVEVAPLFNTEVAHYFGVQVWAIRFWKKQGLLRCTLHRHADERALYEGCMPEIVRPHLSPGTNPLMWCKKRRRPDAQPLITPGDAARMGHVDKRYFTSRAEKGAIVGIKTFGGKWYLTKRSAQECIWARHAQLSSRGR